MTNFQTAELPVLAEIAKTSQKSITKQVSLNDEIFATERQSENKKIKQINWRQQSLPETQFLHEAGSSEEKPKSFKESFLSASKNRKFELIRDGISKLRSSDKPSSESDSKIVISSTSSSTGTTSSSLKVGIAKMFTKWKTEADDGTVELEQKSFTQKRGVNIDPINVFGLRRDQSLDSATRRGLFHK